MTFQYRNNFSLCLTCRCSFGGEWWLADPTIRVIFLFERQEDTRRTCYPNANCAPGKIGTILISSAASMTADRSLVHSMKRRCEYTDQDLQVQAQAGSTSTSSDVLLEQLSTNDFPVALFLDLQVFKQFNIELRAPRLPIPRGVAEVIEDANRIHEISSSYFKTVHPWFPVISRNKFYGNLLNRASYQDCDLALLVLCMRLILHQPSNSGTRTHSRLYVKAKKYIL